MAARRSTSTSTAGAPAASDAYVGLLLISLLAQIVGVVFFYMDLSQYPDRKAPSVPNLPSGPPPAVVPPAGGPGGAPPVGGMAGMAGAAGGPAGGMAGMAGMAGAAMAGGMVK